MIDSLWAMGQRLRSEGISSPLDDIQQANKYSSLAEAKKAVQEAGRRIQEHGLPDEIVPFICGFTGYGKVGNGAQHIFGLLPVIDVTPESLTSFFNSGKFSKNVVYKIEFKKSHLYELMDREATFELQEFNTHPERYRSRFEKFVPYLMMVINGIYWEPRFPRLVSKKFLKSLYGSDVAPRLRVIGDITCDIDGSVEATVKATNSENPVYVYEPLKDRVIDGWEGNGPVVLAVDKLPTEIPLEASAAFGDALLPFIPALAAADYEAPREKLLIPREFQKAVITHRGALTSEYQYLAEYIR